MAPLLPDNQIVRPYTALGLLFVNLYRRVFDFSIFIPQGHEILQNTLGMSKQYVSSLKNFLVL